MAGVDEYLETRVLTAPPEKLHLLVVDGAIRQAQKALAALSVNDFEKAHFALNESRQFVTELIGGLDQERSPDVVERLKGLFLFVYRGLVLADMEHDQQNIEQAIDILRLHRETWQQLCERLAADNLSQQQALKENASSEPGQSGHCWDT